MMMMMMMIMTLAMDTGLVVVQWPRYGFTGFFYGLTKAANRCNDGDDDEDDDDGDSGDDDLVGCSVH